MSSLPPEQVHAIVDDEIIRQRVREHIGDTPRTSELQNLLRHPLTSLVLGFALTGILGAFFTHRIAADREDAIRRADAKRVQVEAALSSTQEFSRLIYERQGRAALLLSAIHRAAEREELRERKLSYDKSFIDWERNIKANLLTVRAASGWRGYSPFEQVVDEYLIPTYRSLDSALTIAYDRRRNSQPIGDLRAAGRLLLITRACSNKITDSLYEIIPVFTEQVGIPEDLTAKIIKECTASPPDSITLYMRAP